MLYSMTGYGRAIKKDKNFTLTVEIRSLNSKYFDIISRVDDSIIMYENEIIKLIKNKCERGKFFLNINISNNYTEKNKIKLNKEKFNYYMNQINLLKKKMKTEQEISLSHMMKLPDVFEEISLINKNNKKQLLTKTVNVALMDLLKHRLKEGENIKKDIILKVNEINEKINKIIKLSKPNLNLNVKNYNKKINKIFNNIELDKERVYQEIAILIERKNIDEEIVRIKSHIKLFLSSIKSRENTGKKINFILQEMSREVNTIGSKTDKLKISHLVVDLKDVIGKIKEQVQNIL